MHKESNTVLSTVQIKPSAKFNAKIYLLLAVETTKIQEKRAQMAHLLKRSIGMTFHNNFFKRY